MPFLLVNQKSYHFAILFDVRYICTHFILIIHKKYSTQGRHFFVSCVSWHCDMTQRSRCSTFLCQSQCVCLSIPLLFPHFFVIIQQSGVLFDPDALAGVQRYALLKAITSMVSSMCENWLSWL